MKRIRSACLIQTLHFQPKEGISQDQAAAWVQDEYAQCRARLERHHTRYRIVKEEAQPDGSLVIEIKKQYNTAPCGDYLD